MLNITLTQVQTYLGLPIQADTKMSAILDGVNDKVESNVGDLSLGEKTMTVNVNAIKNNTFTLNVINPTSLSEINGTDFTTKTNGTDYFIKNDGEVIINNLFDYLSTDNVQNFGFFDVKFNAGYENAPNSLIAIVSEYVGYLYSQDNGKDVLEEQLGPRGVVYEGNSQNGLDIALRKFKNSLKKYIPLALRIY